MDGTPRGAPHEPMQKYTHAITIFHLGGKANTQMYDLTEDPSLTMRFFLDVFGWEEGYNQARRRS